MKRTLASILALSLISFGAINVANAADINAGDRINNTTAQQIMQQQALKETSANFEKLTATGAIYNSGKQERIVIKTSTNAPLDAVYYVGKHVIYTTKELNYKQINQVLGQLGVKVEISDVAVANTTGYFANGTPSNLSFTPTTNSRLMQDTWERNRNLNENAIRRY